MSGKDHKEIEVRRPVYRLAFQPVENTLAEFINANLLEQKSTVSGRLQTFVDFPSALFQGPADGVIPAAL